MSALTIGPSYTGGIGQAITDAVAAGHNQLLLQAGAYAADTCTSGAHGPGGTVPWLTISPIDGRESIAINDLLLDGANYLRFLNCRFASAVMSAPSTVTLPIYDGASPMTNAGIKLTPVVSDLPVPRFRIRNPKAANRTQSLVVTVENRDITVTGVSTDADSRITTTALSIISAVNAAPAAAALVTAAVKDGQDGSGQVQGGLPFWEVWGGGYADIELETDGHHIELVGCKLSLFKLNQGCHSVKVKHCYYPRSSFPLTCSVNAGDRTISDVRFSNNYCYGGYDTDCMGPRPAEVDNFIMDDNVFEDGCDPEVSSKHMDTFQPLFGGRCMKIRRNKFIDMAGQCFFMDNFIFHQVLIENNLIIQDGEANQICQLSGIKTGMLRFNTIVGNGWLFDDGDGNQRPDSLYVYNNVTNRFSRTTGVSVLHDYNIVQTAGTGWTVGTNETNILPSFAGPGYPNWDYHFLSDSQPGAGDGTTVFRQQGSPATDLDGNPRDPGIVDQGCYVA